MLDKLPDRAGGSAAHVAITLMKTLGVVELQRLSAACPLDSCLRRNDEQGPGDLQPGHSCASRNPGKGPLDEASPNHVPPQPVLPLHVSGRGQASGGDRFPFARYHLFRKMRIVHIIHCRMALQLVQRIGGRAIPGRGNRYETAPANRKSTRTGMFHWIRNR